MKGCVLERNEKQLDEKLIICDKKEFKIIYKALEEYCINHKRERNAKKVLDEIEKLPLFDW
jgi:hypothetical protein